jgi:predicted Zn-dependent peptidase
LFVLPEHFPDESILSVLETFGMKLGADINASTSYDHTHYDFVVPIDHVMILTIP